MHLPDLVFNAVSRETSDRLDILSETLNKWNPRINLVAPATLPDLQQRHIADSAQLVAFLPTHTQHWVDLGSGGGFPGLVVAILAAELHPDVRVTLVESDKRKAAFLKTTAHACNIEISVIADRAENVTPQRAEILSARALASLSQLLPLAQRHLAPEGLALFPKGVHYEQEIIEARKDWRFEVSRFPSRTSPDGHILVVKDIDRA